MRSVLDTQSTAPSNKVINFAEKFSLFTEQWTPKVISAMNDYQFKLVKVEGEFIWHSHADTDEVFIVLEGELEIYLRDVKVTLNSGEMYVVKKGVEHKPCALREAKIMLIEPRGVINTGEVTNALTAENDQWI
ncbi:cupin domain-containing protein [Pseudomonas syringae]|uniref:cupin domain-containing protein n=1 Tax=Pseudomonas syringae TaxID=317 RepID=UPI0006ACF097|nr:cupin [Pseudomonas syringae pv. syringae]